MLLDELEAAPRVSVAQLQRILARDAARPRFGREVAEAIASRSAQLERPGAWLLRHWLQQGGNLAAGDWELVVNGLDDLRDWVARLELCRIVVERPEQADGVLEEMAAFLRSCAAAPQPFVRAWAVTAFQAVARRHPEWQTEARQQLGRARRDPAKSVRARLRRLG